MRDDQKIEILSVGFAICVDGISLSERLAWSSCFLVVLDMIDQFEAKSFRQVGGQSLPAVESMDRSCA